MLDPFGHGFQKGASIGHDAGIEPVRPIELGRVHVDLDEFAVISEQARTPSERRLLAQGTPHYQDQISFGKRIPGRAGTIETDHPHAAGVRSRNAADA